MAHSSKNRCVGGPPELTQAELLVRAFSESRNIVQMASACQKPREGLASPQLAERLQPLQNMLLAVTSLRDQHRGDKLFNHLSTVSEGVPALGWIAVEPTPAPYIGDMIESAQFYANRVIKEHKGLESEPAHTEWCRTFISLLDVLKAYVLQHHRTGLSWNAQGSDLASYQGGASVPPVEAPKGALGAVAQPPAAAGDVPPPPPPPPAVASTQGSTAPSMDAVFGEINQGVGITRSLRKVDQSEMTHKNPALRASGTVEDRARSAPAAKPAALSVKKRPPSMVLEGNKWTLENYDGAKELVIENTELNHTVNVFSCDNCVIQVKGKVNAVSLVSCHKTAVLLDTLVSAFEVTRCNSITAQITGHTPTVLLDNTDGAQVYLSDRGFATEVVTAKCSSLNVSVPSASRVPGDFEELPLPEQLKHVFMRDTSGKAIVRSEVVQHAG